MTYTDEELVRELEHRYPECSLVKQACERLWQLHDDVEDLQRWLKEKEDEEEDCDIEDGPIDRQYLSKEYTG